MANISVRLNEQEEELFKTYAEFMDETLSTLFKKALLEKIEDEFDLKVGQKALAEYNIPSASCAPMPRTSRSAAPCTMTARVTTTMTSCPRS